MPGRRSIAIIAGVLIVVLATTNVCAQDDGEDVRLTRAHFDQAAVALDFTAAQRQTAETKFEAYEREFDDAYKTYKGILDWLWSATSSEGWYGGSATSEFMKMTTGCRNQADQTWRFAARRLEAKWFDELRHIAIGREETVDSLRRARLRERVFRSSNKWEPAGVETDLVSLVVETDPALADQPLVRRVLDDYELRLDALVRAFDESNVTFRSRYSTARSAMLAAQAAGQDFSHERDAMITLYVEWLNQLPGIWRLHQQTAALLLAAAPVDRRAVLDDAIFKSLHRYLWSEQGQSPDEAFARASAIKSLNSNQQERMDVLRERWRVRRNPAVSALTRVYMLRFDPVIVSENMAAAAEGKPQPHAYWREWSANQEPWLIECADVVRAIDKILNEERGASSP